jgi:hypothetical protein
MRNDCVCLLALYPASSPRNTVELDFEDKATQGLGPLSYEANLTLDTRLRALNQQIPLKQYHSIEDIDYHRA